MRHVNGVYTQTFNRRHSLVGHVLQGRFKAILVDRDAYLLEVDIPPMRSHCSGRMGSQRSGAWEATIPAHGKPVTDAG
jgi:hypothetical protein